VLLTDFEILIFMFFFKGSVDDVEALLKRHEDFENSLYAQDERLKTFCEMANKLISTNHYDRNQ